MDVWISSTHPRKAHKLPEGKASRLMCKDNASLYFIETAQFEQHFWSQVIQVVMFHRWVRLNWSRYFIVKKNYNLRKKLLLQEKYKNQLSPSFFCLAFNETSGPPYTTCSAASCQHQRTEISCSGKDALLLSPFTAWFSEVPQGPQDQGQRGTVFTNCLQTSTTISSNMHSDGQSLV